MTHPTLVLDELVSQVAKRTVEGHHDGRVEPLSNPDTGESDGMLIESLLERVVMFVRAPGSLSLADVSHVRRSMARAQARPAYVYVPNRTNVQKQIMLLATLSKIHIVKVEIPELIF